MTCIAQWIPLVLLTTACASVPRPALLDQVDAVRSSDATQESRRLVPHADAKAEKLREDAEAAWPKGHTASAEILAERALLTYADARELARIVRAEQRVLAAKAEVHQAELALLKLQAAQMSAAAEAADLEAQLTVERESEEIAGPKASTPDREQARLVAAKTALSQARLLCVSAQLLGSAAPQPNTDVIAALSEIDGIDAKSMAGKFPAPLRGAIAARSRCQRLLTAQRRPAVMANPTSEKSDQLFVELANAGFAPSRDDRGIVINLYDAFAGADLASPMATKLAALGQLAQSNDQAPVLVVTHTTRGEPKPIDRSRGEAAAARLKAAGANQVQSQAVGGRMPIAAGKDLGANRLNERLEVIFVTRL